MSNAQSVEIGKVLAYPYTKKGDSKDKIRMRILDKVVVNGKICQVNGFITSIGEQ